MESTSVSDTIELTETEALKVENYNLKRESLGTRLKDLQAKYQKDVKMIQEAASQIATEESAFIDGLNDKYGVELRHYKLEGTMAVKVMTPPIQAAAANEAKDNKGNPDQADH